LKPRRWLPRRIGCIPARAAVAAAQPRQQLDRYPQGRAAFDRRQLFRLQRTRGVEVVHVDRRELPLVERQADLTNHGDVLRLGALHPGALLCCNLLEHVTEPDRLAYHCLELLMPGGLVFVTVPFSYPYHRDPIDTMYRPSPSGWGSHTAMWCASGHN